MMKKTLLLSLVLLVGFVPHALAAFVPLAPIPGLTDIQPSTSGLAGFFNNLYKYCIGLAAALAVIEIIWGGLEISTQDSVSKKSDGKERITQAIFGLILVLAPVLVFSIINPNILNLSLNLPAIGTVTGAVVQQNGGTGTVTDSTTQCSVTGSADIFQIATCPSGAAATAWGANCTSPGILSAITPITNNPDGTIASCRISCAKRYIFEFIDVHTGASLDFTTQIQPLAVSSNSSTNGSDALQFVNNCRSLGKKTCISDSPSLTFGHSCTPLPTTALPAGAPSPAKCYTETLTCEDASFINPKCASNPSWTPFQ